MLACTGGNPELQRIDQALEAYAEGQDQLDRGRPQDAIEAFQRAAALDPQSATLQLWVGKAQADAGDLPAAIASADRALQLQSSFTEARYDRACWKARAGQLEGALADLEQARRDPSLDPFLVLTDPDLVALREHAELSRGLPLPVLPSSVQAQEGSVFLRGEWTLDLAVQHRPQDELRLSAPASSAPLRLRKLVEDRVQKGSLVETSLRFSFTAIGAGQGTLGPWTAEAGPLGTELSTVSYVLLAPEGQASESEALDFTPVSRRLQGLERASREGDVVTVVGLPGDRIEWAADQVTLLELREAGQPERVGWVGVLPQSSAVRLLRGNRTVWELEL